MADHESHHHVNYLAVFVALCVFTGLSVVFDVVDIPNRALLIVLVLAVAVAKALCVMAFFMHLKFERNWKYVLLAPTTILAIGVPLALMPDVGVHYYAVAVPQETQLRQAVKEVFAGEDKSNPYTDEDAAEIIRGKHHYDINAATITRYRAALNIPDAEERKPGD